MNIVYPLLGISLGFIFVYLSIPTIINVARLKHLYDEPNERNVTNHGVPTLGGVAIFIGFTISTIIATNGYQFNEFKYLLGAIIIMFFVGLKDDILVLSARKKLFAQILTGVMLIVLGDFRFTSLHGVFGVHEINYAISFPLTLFIMIVIFNAFNLIDGIDGLAAGISILTASTFGIWFMLSGHYEYGIMCMGFTGSMGAFFLYNVFGNTNKIFMGDTGSLLLGVIMAIVVIKFNEFNLVNTSPYAIQSAPAVSFGILIVPMIDTLRVFIIRLSQKRSPFSPDMNHVHHRLLKLGNSHLQTTLIILAVNTLFVAFSFAIGKILNVNYAFLTIVLLGFAVAFIPSYILYQKKKSTDSFSFFNFQHNSLITKSVKMKAELVTSFSSNGDFPKKAGKSADKKKEKTAVL